MVHPRVSAYPISITPPAGSSVCSPTDPVVLTNEAVQSGQLYPVYGEQETSSNRGKV